MRERLPGPNPEDRPRNFQGLLPQEFANTLRFSQGNDFTQTSLSTLVAAYYRQILSPHRLEEARTALRTIGNMPPFGMPAEHRDVKHTEGPMRGMWRDFSDRFQWPNLAIISDANDRKGPMSDPSGPYDYNHLYEQEVARLCGNMLDIDASYVESGRPARAEGSDPHKSLYREYVLGGKPTSPAFTSFFTDARMALFTEGIPDELQNLRHVWEDKHPGQQFYPENFVADREKFLANNLPDREMYALGDLALR